MLIQRYVFYGENEYLIDKTNRHIQLSKLSNNKKRAKTVNNTLSSIRHKVTGAFLYETSRDFRLN